MSNTTAENRPPMAVSNGQTPMRILMVAARYFPFMGGIETHIHETSRRLVARGHTVRILTTDPAGTLPVQQVVDGVEIIRVKAWPSNRDYYLAPAIWREIGRDRWDVLHVQGYHTLVPPLATIAARKFGIPFVLTFHSGGHSVAFRNRIRAYQQRALAPLVRHAAQLIGVSEHEAEHFSAAMNIPRERFVVVPNGAELPKPTQGRVVAHNPDAPLILSVGRLEKYKGHHRVIEAMPHILQSKPGARLRVLGEGPFKEELKSLVVKLGLSDKIEVGGLPVAQRQQMADLMQDAAVVALISEYEAHPVAVLEALSLGRPVVATYSSGFKEMARDGVIDTVPLDADAPTVAAAILRTASAPPRATKIKLPNWDDCTVQLEGIYRDVVSKGVQPTGQLAAA